MNSRVFNKLISIRENTYLNSMININLTYKGSTSLYDHELSFNLVNGVELFQPLNSRFLCDSVINKNTKWVYLTGIKKCLPSENINIVRHVLNAYHIVIPDVCKINCDYVLISVDNAIEIINMLYDVLTQCDYFILQDFEFRNHVSDVKYGRNLKRKTYCTSFS